MSKNYILEPTELTSPYLINPPVFSDEDFQKFDDTYFAELSDGSVLKFAKYTPSSSKIPVSNVEFYEEADSGSETTKYLQINYGEIPRNSGTIVNAFVSHILDGEEDSPVWTVAIYTETPDTDPGAGLSKNVVYNDHPYNNWETLLSKKGDPKTGYNTIEKLANATDVEDNNEG